MTDRRVSSLTWTVPPTATGTGDPGPTGLYVVSTQTARYLLDLDAGTLTRYPATGPAQRGWTVAALRQDGEQLDLVSVQATVGGSLVAALKVRQDALSVRLSTEVLSIEPVTDDEPDAVT